MPSDVLMEHLTVNRPHSIYQIFAGSKIRLGESKNYDYRRRAMEERLWS